MFQSRRIQRQRDRFFFLPANRGLPTRSSSSGESGGATTDRRDRDRWTRRENEGKGEGNRGEIDPEGFYYNNIEREESEAKKRMMEKERDDIGRGKENRKRAKESKSKAPVTIHNGKIRQS